MTDSDTRTLERRWRTTGSPQAEAAWLAARVRAGTLTPERVRIAFYLGSPGASILQGQRPSPPTRRSLPQWVAVLAAAGSHLTWRTTLAAAEVSLAQQWTPVSPTVQATVEWLGQPERGPGWACSALAAEVEQRLLPALGSRKREQKRRRRVVTLLSRAARVAAYSSGALPDCLENVTEAAKDVGYPRLVPELRGHLLPWVLASADPL